MTAKQEPKGKEAETKYAVADLIAAGPSTFNVMPEIVAGALHDKKEATQSETKAAIKTFLSTPVKPEEEKGAAN